MTERFLIWGAGGHGRVVRDTLLACGDLVVGFVDRNPSPALSGLAQSPPVLPELSLEADSLPLGATAIAFGLGDNHLRLVALEQIKVRLRCPSRVHPSAVVGSGVEIGLGTIVMAGAVISANASLGEGVIVNTGAVVEHDCQVGAGAHIAPGAVLCGGVQVGRLAWIGAGAVVVPLIRIGERAIVGAGSTAIEDVPTGTTVVGNPAKLSGTARLQ